MQRDLVKKTGEYLIALTRRAARAAIRKHLVILVYMLSLTLGLPLGLATKSFAAEKSRLISVYDVVRFATIGDPRTLDWNEDTGEPGIFSPDRSEVLIVVSSGDPEHENNNAALWLYRTADLMSDPKPVKLAEFASATPHRPIAFVHWLADNQTVVFAGTRGGDVSQIFRVNIRTQVLEQLTHSTEQLLWYDVSTVGNRLVTFAEPAALPPAKDPQCRRYGCRVQSADLVDAESGNNDTNALASVHDLITGDDKPLISPESQDDSLSSCDIGMAGGLSPDGRYAIRLCTVRAQRLPSWWGEYATDATLHGCILSHNARCWRRGFVTDLTTGRSMAWTDAPLWHPAYIAQPIWIDGGHRVIFPTAFESLNDIDAKERARRTKLYAVQILDLATRKMSRIGRLDPKVVRMTKASWNSVNETLMVRGEDVDGNSLPPAYFHRAGAKWVPLQATDIAASPRTGAKLVIEESLNAPPVLKAIDQQTGVNKKILDPNPWLATRELGRVEAVSWGTRNGRAWRGGLYYPPDYQAGRRYPLLLQTHGFEPGQFSLNGWAKNFPGQALASHGMFILQIDEDSRDQNGTDTGYSTKYWEAMQAGYEGAIDHLDQLGLIDPGRVGTLGFSATGPSTGYLFTHSEYAIAAAAFGDTGGDGLWSYFSWGGSQGTVAHFGTQPFGDGIGPWLELSPSFNLARVRTPLLMFQAESPLGTWDFYAGLRSLNRPVELWSLPTGTHDVYQASQRMRMNQLLVDWFCFWLKAEQRTEVGAYAGETAQSLADQYARWGGFRKQQEGILKQPRPPLLKWTATPVTTNEAH